MPKFNGLKLEIGESQPQQAQAEPNLNRQTEIRVNNQLIEIRPDNFRTVRDLGRGAYGVVEMIEHIASGVKLAVKRIQASNLQDQDRLLRDMHVLIKTRGCPNIVEFYGAIYWEAHVYLFMEIMDASLDVFYKKAFKKRNDPNSVAVPENVLGKIAGSVLSALHYLRQMDVIHRDVKPSNILINRCGIVKLCDFGIAGYLENSVAKTYEAGCKPYMAPERLRPNQQGYNSRSDVWSLGLTMIEITTGEFPYRQNDIFAQLKAIYDDPAPKLPPNQFSNEYQQFVTSCLEKKVEKRPNFAALLEYDFVKKYLETDISDFTRNILEDIN